MKFLRFGLFAMVGLLLTLLALAVFKDSGWKAEGAVLVEAPPERILPLVSSPKHWLDWNPWSDPAAEGFEVSFSGPETGPGAKMSWKTATKHGELQILSVSAADGVGYELDLDDMPGKGQIRPEPYGAQTRVRWVYSGDMGWNLPLRFAVSFMQRALVATMQKGLTNLRERVTKGG